MRRSFGPGMGGGGGGGGGGMIKTVHRAVRAGIGGGATPESYNSHTATTTRTTSNNNRNQPINTTTTLSLSSSNNTNSASPCSYLNNHPVPPTNWGFTTSPVAGEEFDWEYVDGGAGESDGDSVNGFYDDLVFGNVPSQQEVHHAVSSLQEVLEPVSFAQLIKNRETAYSSDDNGVEKILSPTSFHKLGSELDWIEPSLQLYNTLQVPSSDKVYDAFHLLQTEPSVQRMVISLSSDKAVWDAVMNNEVVRELRESVIEDKSISDGPKDDDSNPVSRVLRRMFMNTKDRVIEIVEKITKMVNELVQPMNNKKNKDVNHVGLGLFEEKLRSSFFLSIMVLLIVVVSRSRKC